MAMDPSQHPRALLEHLRSFAAIGDELVTSCNPHCPASKSGQMRPTIDVKILKHSFGEYQSSTRTFRSVVCIVLVSQLKPAGLQVYSLPYDQGRPASSARAALVLFLFDPLQHALHEASVVGIENSPADGVHLMQVVTGPRQLRLGRPPASCSHPHPPHHPAWLPHPSAASLMPWMPSSGSPEPISISLRGTYRSACRGQWKHCMQHAGRHAKGHT